jgi:DNA (cytosine-5)-methyltransferase 1
MLRKLNFIDLFAGAGGLSEGFIQAGFEPIAHVEIEKAEGTALKKGLFKYFKWHSK